MQLPQTKLKVVSHHVAASLILGDLGLFKTLTYQWSLLAVTRTVYQPAFSYYAAATNYPSFSIVTCLPVSGGVVVPLHFSRLDHCNATFIGISELLTRRLHCVVNSAARSKHHRRSATSLNSSIDFIG